MASPLEQDLDLTVPASPRARRIPTGSKVPVSLRHVRKDLALTQSEVARLCGMSQGDLSRLERRGDHLLSTLQRYVQALGGRLEIAAVFGARRYPIDPNLSSGNDNDAASSDPPDELDSASNYEVPSASVR